MSVENRRKYKRLGQAVEVTIRAISFPLESAAPLRVEMVDVSEGGIGVSSPSEFKEGSSVEVSMKMPGWFRHTANVDRYRGENRLLTAVGTVKRCAVSDGAFELGIEFTDIWADHWSAMRQHLAEIEASTPDRE